MSTRGFVKLGKRFYYIRSDAYPDHAKGKLVLAAMGIKIRNSKEFIRRANYLAGFDWIMPEVKIPQNLSTLKKDVFMEYGYEVNSNGVKRLK